MTARVGVRIDTDTTKAKRDIKTFSKDAQRDLDAVAKKGQQATAGMAKGNAKLGSSLDVVRGKMRPLGEGLESLGTVMGTAGSEAQRFAGGLMRLATGPMGLVTAAAGLATVGIAAMFAKYTERAEEARQRMEKLREAEKSWNASVLAGLSQRERFERGINDKLRERNKLLEQRIGAGRGASRGMGGPGQGVPALPPPNWGSGDTGLGPAGMEITRLAAWANGAHGAFLRTAEGWNALHDKLKAAGATAADLSKLDDELRRLFGDANRQSIDRVGESLRMLNEDFGALDDPMKQIDIRFERMWDKMREGLPLEQSLTAEQRERIALMKTEVNRLRDLAKERSVAAETMRAMAEARALDDAAAKRQAAEMKRGNDFVSGYFQRMEDRGLTPQAHRGQVTGMSTGPDGLKPPPGKDYSGIATTFGNDLGTSVESSLSDAIATGFQNGEQVIQQFSSALMRAVSDALAAALVQSAGIDAESLGGLFGAAFGGEGGAGGADAGGTVSAGAGTP